MTMKVSTGLEFPVVALPGVRHMPAQGEDEQEAARVFYVAATRATQRLVMGVALDWGVQIESHVHFERKTHTKIAYSNKLQPNRII